MTFYLAPKMFLYPGLLTNSGLGLTTHPILHAMLVTRHAEVSTTLFSVIFVLFVISLERGAYRYQISS